jgi:pimeloyl-ACP methyl ester carboxylesterase
VLVGARVTYSQFEPDNPVQSVVRGPAEFPDLVDAIPGLLEASPAFRASWERRREDYSDARFQSALLMAPGRSVLGFETGTLRCIDRPVRIFVGDADRMAPASLCSDWLHRNTPGSQLEILGRGAGHYVFLSEPTAFGLQQAPAVFSDSLGVDRRALHERVASSAGALFYSAR